MLQYTYVQYTLQYNTITYNSCYVILLYFSNACVNAWTIFSINIDLQMTGNFIIITENCQNNNKSLNLTISGKYNWLKYNVIYNKIGLNKD